MNDVFPKIRKIPTDWKYYCECNHEIHPWGFNYCAHCGRKLNWDTEYIIIDCPIKGEKCDERDFFH